MIVYKESAIFFTVLHESMNFMEIIQQEEDP